MPLVGVGQVDAAVGASQVGAAGGASQFCCRRWSQYDDERAQGLEVTVDLDRCKYEHSATLDCLCVVPPNNTGFYPFPCGPRDPPPSKPPAPGPDCPEARLCHINKICTAASKECSKERAEQLVEDCAKDLCATGDLSIVASYKMSCTAVCTAAPDSIRTPLPTKPPTEVPVRVRVRVRVHGQSRHISLLCCACARARACACSRSHPLHVCVPVPVHVLSPCACPCLCPCLCA